MVNKGKEELLEWTSPDEENGTFEEDGPNPLMFPVVLMHLFKSFDLAEHRELRLVCKQWFALTKSRFRNDMRIHISSRMLEGKSWDYFERDKRFHSFRLKGWQMGSCPREPSLMCALHQKNPRMCDNTLTIFKNMNNFWRMHGHSIHQLRLEYCEVSCVKAFKKAIFEDTPNLRELAIISLRNETEGGDKERDDGKGEVETKGSPNLKSLIIELDDRFRFPITWGLLFSHFPEVERLELKHFYFKCDTPELVESLERLSKDESHKWQIKDLKLDRVTYHHGIHIRRLVTLPQFKLETFHFESGGSGSEEQSVLPAALERHGDTLRTLHVQNHNSDSPETTIPYNNFPFRFTAFPSMTELSLEGFVSNNLHFLDKFPNLRILRLKQHFEEKTLKGTDLQKLGKVRLPFVQEFDFVVDMVADYYLPEDAMDMFAKVMPNVLRLKAQLDNDSVRIVCRKLKQLKKLNICTSWQGKIDDEGLTGIVPEGEDRLPNITDLTDLEHLSISQWGNIGDSSVWNGFLQMTKLRALDVRLMHETSCAAYVALLRRFTCPSKIVRRRAPRAH